MQDNNKKPLINVMIEQSKILEKVEELRQLVLSSSLKQERILRLASQLDGLNWNVYSYYQDTINSQQEVGNI